MRSATAITLLVCAVMVLMAAVPLASADTHLVTKGPKGPRASAVTWDFQTGAEIGVWTGFIENNGLRSLVVDVADNSTGTPDEIFHQRIRFAAYNAYPSGTVTTDPVLMAADRLYEITVTPNGPRGSTCTVTDEFKTVSAPVAHFSTSVVGPTVYVDASASTDSDGTIVSYEWEFGDGGTAIGVTASHTYMMGGTYTITLVVTDNDGLWGMTSAVIELPDSPPMAAFTLSVTDLTVNVDASDSSDDFGIVSYSWSWGDGTTGTGVTASHTYGPAMPMVLGDAASADGRAAPLPPYYVLGYVYDAGGLGVADATVVVTNLRTGGFNTTMSLSNGLYSLDINNQLPGGWLAGDTLLVEATSGAMSGSSEGLLTGAGAYIQIDVTLSGGEVPHEFTITLTVTDTAGQTATATQVVTLYW